MNFEWKTHMRSLASFCILAASTFLPRCANGQTLLFNEENPQFGPALLERASTPKVISITNVGDVPVFLRQIATDGEFTQRNACPMWLEEKSTCLVLVTFAPKKPGIRSGRLDVYVYGAETRSLDLIGFGENSNGGSLPQGTPTRTTNDEETARGLRQEKSYSLDAILKGNPADVAHAEKIFDLTKDTEWKRKAASMLVHIGVTDDKYSIFLRNEAEKALRHDRDIPWPLLYTSSRDLSHGADRTLRSGNPGESPNPAFSEWCTRRGLPSWDVFRVTQYEIPSAWRALAAAGSPRFFDLLIKGLHSSNLVIVAMAAEGLARIQDERSIDELISAGQRGQGQTRYTIAQALLFFRDPKAQAGAEELLHDKRAITTERKRVEEEGIKVFFPW